MSELPARPPGIAVEEYAARTRLALADLEARALDGLIVFGRGGGTLDRFADVHYLTGHYPCFPAIPDLGRLWRGRGHAAALLTAADGLELILDEPDTDSPIVGSDRVHSGHDLIGALIALLQSRGLQAARLGLVGTEVLSMAHREAIEAALPQLQLVTADDLVGALRVRKSTAEIDLMRYAAQIGVAQVDAMIEASVSGATEAELVAEAYGVLLGHGGAMANLFIETNGPGGVGPMRRLPTHDRTRQIVEGDLILVDVTGVVGGYWFDLSRSWVVGGEPTQPQRELMDLTCQVVESVVGRLRPETPIAEAIAPAVQLMREAGHPVDESEFPALGHGLGLGFEAPWLTVDNAAPVVEGMVLCVERAVWSGDTAASYEETVLITDSAPEVLTSRPGAPGRAAEYRRSV